MLRSIIVRSLVKSCTAPSSINNSIAMGSTGNIFSLSRHFSSVVPNIAEIATQQPLFSSEISATSRTKHKTPRKRASSLYDILKKEEKERLASGRVYPELVSGDSVRIEKLPFASAEKPDVITGVIIAKYNKSYDTRIDVLNVSDDKFLFLFLITQIKLFFISFLYLLLLYCLHFGFPPPPLPLRLYLIYL